MKTSSAKAKGRKLQQWVRDKLLELSPEFTLEDIRSTGMGQGGEDVQLSTEARKVWPLSIECKARQAFAFYKDYNQAVANAPDNTEPILVCKGNNKKPVVIVDADYFFKQVRK